MCLSIYQGNSGSYVEIPVFNSSKEACSTCAIVKSLSHDLTTGKVITTVSHNTYDIMSFSKDACNKTCMYSGVSQIQASEMQPPH